MKILLTGSSGRIGRAIYGALASEHEVIGVDTRVFSTTHILGDCTNPELLKLALEGCDAVIHTAGPHAPHVGVVPEAEFERVNVEGTARLFERAKQAGAKRFIYTSTTALYGHTIRKGECIWVDETTEPQPKSIYHRTKLAAEHALHGLADTKLPVTVLRMSRCFPEPGPAMTAYRMHRGIDARDVATGHSAALKHQGSDFERYILSGSTPFEQSDCEALAHNAPDVIRQRIPEIAELFEARGWELPRRIDRVYSPASAQSELGWQPRWDWREVVDQLDRQSIEVLPAKSRPAIGEE